MPAIRRHWTTADVRALTSEERAWPRYELIDGELFVTPAPASTHQIACAELWRLLDEYLEREPVGIALTSPSDLELREGTITQPDVFVLPRETEITGDVLLWSDVRSLLLAVEILSPSSIRTDRIKKRDFYLENHVEEYWIIDVDARFVERWMPQKEHPEIVRQVLRWTPVGAAPLDIDLVNYFDRIRHKTSILTKRDQRAGNQ